MTLVLAVGVVAPLIVLYFLVIKGADRYEPEPLWLLLSCFVWGAVVATAAAMIGNAIGEGAVAAAMGVGASASLVDASTASFVAPLVEESTKGGGLLLLWGLSALWLHELDGPLDGAIYGGVIGLGFTLTEDVLYIAHSADSAGLSAMLSTWLLRTVFAGLGHASFTAMTGLGIGLAVEARSALGKLVAPVIGWSCAVALHFAHNFLVTFLFANGVGLLIKLLAFWFLDVVFFLLVLGLALRDRAIVAQGLADEVGHTLLAQEFARTTSPLMLLPLWNYFGLSGSRSGWRAVRSKQLDLVELAFTKMHQQRSGYDSRLAAREQELRRRIHFATSRGVIIGV
jgi:RsiW-degrading membrane proteinase PrsW (M82 family)